MCSASSERGAEQPEPVSWWKPQYAVEVSPPSVSTVLRHVVLLAVRAGRRGGDRAPPAPLRSRDDAAVRDRPWVRTDLAGRCRRAPARRACERRGRVALGRWSGRRPAQRSHRVAQAPLPAGRPGRPFGAHRREAAASFEEVGLGLQVARLGHHLRLSPEGIPGPGAPRALQGSGGAGAGLQPGYRCHLCRVRTRCTPRGSSPPRGRRSPSRRTWTRGCPKERCSRASCRPIART